MKAKIQLLQFDDINASMLMLDGKLYTLSAPEEILTHPDIVGLEMLIVAAGDVDILTDEGPFFISNINTPKIDRLTEGKLFDNGDRPHYLVFYGQTDITNPDNKTEKILASTVENPHLPFIHKAFIEKYISEYDNGNEITDVWVVDDHTNPSKPFVGTNGCIVVKKYTPEKFEFGGEEIPAVDEAPLSPKVKTALDKALDTAKMIMDNSTYGSQPVPSSDLQVAVDKIFSDKTILKAFEASTDIKKIAITIEIEPTDNLDEEVIQTADKLTKDLSWEEIVNIVMQIK